MPVGCVLPAEAPPAPPASVPARARAAAATSPFGRGRPPSRTLDTPVRCPPGRRANHACPSQNSHRKCDCYGRTHPHEKTVLGHQGAAPRLPALFPAGGLLRDVRRGCQGGRGGAQPHPHHPGPEQAPGGAHPHVRGALSLRRGLHRPAHRQGVQGGHLRADRGPRPGQGAGGPGGDPGGHPRHPHRGEPVGGGEEQLPGFPLCHPRRGGAVLWGHLHRGGGPHLLPGGGVGQPGGERAGPVCPPGGPPLPRGGGACPGGLPAKQAGLPGGAGRGGPL